MSSISNEKKWKYLSFAVIGVLATSLIAVAFQLPQQLQDTLFAEQVNAPFGLPSAYGAGALTNVFALPSNNLYKGTGFYNVGFTTATTGTIKTIEITFPAGFSVAGAKLIQSVGMGAGSISISGQVVKYTITTAVSVTAPKAMMILIGNIINSGVTSNQVSVATKDAAAVVIDGPTNSATFTLTRVTNSMVQSGIALTGSASIDSPTFKVDSTNDRVGIGTTTPQGKLSIMNGDVLIGNVPYLPFINSHSLWLTNDAGDSNNSFRIDPANNAMYIIGDSAPGASSDASIIFRTGKMGLGEADTVVIGPDQLNSNVPITANDITATHDIHVNNDIRVDGDVNAANGFVRAYGLSASHGAVLSGHSEVYGEMFFINSQSSGHSIILKSPNYTCYEISVDNSGTLQTTAVTCAG